MRSPIQTPSRFLMRAAFAVSLVLATLGIGVPDATADASCDTMLVRRVRLIADSPASGVPAWLDYRSGVLEIQGRFRPTAELADHDPEADVVRLTVGPALGVSASRQSGARVTFRRGRVTSHSLRMSRGHGYRFSADLRRGRFAATIRGVDVGALLAEGPTNVVVLLEIGDVEYRAAIDAHVNRRGWRFGARPGSPVPQAPEEPAPADAGELSFTVLGSGDCGWQGPALTRAFAVRTQDDLDRIWAFREAGEPGPQLDFTHDMVIFVDLGRRPTLGYRADVVRVLTSACGPRVEFTEFAPSVAEQAEGHPWAAISVPATGGIVDWRRVPE